MSRLLATLLTGATLLVLPLTINAQSIELQAISDFTERESGAVPYYLDIAGGRNVLAIDAAIPDYRNKFARAEHEFIGPDGIYDITIKAMGEIDGDGTYRLLVNGIMQGAAVNPPVSVDYTIIEHTFPGIALTSPVIIGVESNAVSNDTIPEGDGYAFARGRWRSVVLSVPEGTGVVTADDTVDLALNLSTVETLARNGGQLPIVVSVINQSESITATSPIVTFALPDGVRFSNGEMCSAIRTGVQCVLPEIAPGEVTNTSFTVDITQAGWLSISAALSSDQADTERSNNTANLTFESAETDVSTMTDESQVTPTNPASNNSGNAIAAVTSNTNDTVGGGLFGAVSVLLLLLGNWIRRREMS